MDTENQAPNEHNDSARLATEPLVLSQMRHHAARPIAFPSARAVWEGDDPLLRRQINHLLDDLDDDEALPPPPPSLTDDPADVAAQVAAPPPARPAGGHPAARGNWRTAVGVCHALPADRTPGHCDAHPHRHNARD